MAVKIRFLVGVFVIAGVLASLAAETVRPRWMAQVSTGKPGNAAAALKPCALTYQLSWNGILKAGEASMTLGQPDPNRPGVVLGKCQGRSAGLAKRFWFYQNRFESRTQAKTLRPLSFVSEETESKEAIRTEAVFAKGVVTSKETVRQRKGKNKGQAKARTRVFAYEHSHDMLSAMLYLRSLPLRKGDEVTMVVHPFKSAYLTKFRVLGRETFKGPLGKVPAIKLEIKLHKIAGNMELKSYKKFKSATIWVSDDAYRLPLEVRSEVFVGSVRATLQKRRFLK